MTGHAKDNNDEDDDYDWTEDKSAPTDVSRGKLSQFERLCICNVALFKTTPLANSRKDQLLYQRKLSKPWMIPMIRGHFQTLTKNHGVRKKPHKFHDFAGHWTKDSSDVTNNTPSVFFQLCWLWPKVWAWCDCEGGVSLGKIQSEQEETTTNTYAAALDRCSMEI